MRTPNTLFILGALTASTLAEELDTEKKETSVLPALKVLPAGSILSGVRIPRYNKDYTPASLLEAKQLKVISKQKIQGSSVDLKIYDKQGQIQASTHLNTINYDQATELITSEETFTFTASQFKTTSQGLILDWKNRRGFFLGKNHTIVYLKESAPMKDNKNTANSTPIKALSAIAAASIATTPNALSAATAEDIAEIDRLSQPSNAQVQLINTQLTTQIQAANKTSAEIDKTKDALEKTIKQTDKTLLNKEAPDAPFTIPPELKPEEGKDHFSIKSEGNIFFDGKQGMMVFRKNVKVNHPEYQFSCAGEVKLLLMKKEQPKPLTDKPTKDLKPNEKFGEIDKIIATDNITIVGKDKDGNPITARAGSLVYEHTSGIIILRGLNSRITMADKQLKIVEKNGHIRIDRSWNVDGKGVQIDLNLEKLKQDAKKTQ